MKYILDIDIPEDKKSFIEEFFVNISFIKNVREICSNEITNPPIIQSIEDYESGKTQPSPMNLNKLKDWGHV